MRQLQRRQIVIIGVVAALVVAFLVWKVALSGGGSDNNTVQPGATVTSVANAQTQTQTQQQSGGSAQSSTNGSQSAGSSATDTVPYDSHATRDPFSPAG
jgi:hypothetical protein